MNLYSAKSQLKGFKETVVNSSKRWLSMLLQYRSMKGGREVLEAEYLSGAWDYLRNLNELPRFYVVAGYCHYFKKLGTILEVGCGEGILQERLDRSKFSRYVGVDISEEAIRRASRKQDEKTLFLREDASSFKPSENFDVIIFNECLEYFDDPLELVRRYERFLREDGIYIVSMFAGLDTARTKRIWKMLESVYSSEAETRVSTKSNYSWIIKVFVPSKSQK